jgi:hypothetical protein
LKEDNGVATDVSRIWIQNGQILPLLHSLEQVELEHRADCVRAINTFQAEQREKLNVAPIVVCSTIKGYLEITPERLQFSGAAVIQPLGRRQVETYLQRSNPATARIREALSSSETLWQLVETPEMLYTLSYININELVKRVRPTDSIEAQREGVDEANIESLLQQCDVSKTYMRTDTIRWLGWLAHMF